LIFIEEISRGLVSLGAIMNVQIMQCCYSLWDSVNERQRKEWLMPAIAGKKILAFALGEESCGSDAFNISTIASCTPEGWLLNGSKYWITNAGVADGYIVAAKTKAGDRNRNVSLFYVDAGSKGVEACREKLLGFNNSPTGRVEFHDCLLPPDSLIGSENGAYRIIKDALNYGRLAAAAMSIGAAQAALELSVAYSRERGHFDRAISSYQGVSFPIADMYTQIITNRNMMYHVAERAEAGCRITMDAAALKLSASEMCRKICDDMLLIHAGAGCRVGNAAERLVRDSRLLTIVNGTSQICRTIIANRLFLDPDNIPE
ncbi:MAG: acyl-CoA dehydrogenase family protein, partial [Coprococcus sp.]